PQGAPQQVDPLEEPLLLAVVEALLRHHFFAIECPALQGQGRQDQLPDRRGLLLSVHDVEVMPRIALVYRDPGDLPFAAVVAQHALLLSDWQPGIGWRDVEP